MATRPKRPRDPNQLGKLIVDIAIGEIQQPKIDPSVTPKGRAGGLAGGKARAIVLTPKRRRQIAKKAAKARWKAVTDDG